MLQNIIVTPLKRIETAGGDVLHALKNTDIGYCGFGESYFSFVDKGAIKAWKCHRNMTLNLVVPVGTIRFVFCESLVEKKFRELIIGDMNYSRITVPPKVIFGFQGLGNSLNLVMNISDIPHDPHEVHRFSLDDIGFKWNDWEAL